MPFLCNGSDTLNLSWIWTLNLYKIKAFLKSSVLLWNAVIFEIWLEQCGRLNVISKGNVLYGRCINNLTHKTGKLLLRTEKKEEEEGNIVKIIIKELNIFTSIHNSYSHSHLVWYRAFYAYDIFWCQVPSIERHSLRKIPQHNAIFTYGKRFFKLHSQAIGANSSMVNQAWQAA